MKKLKKIIMPFAIALSSIIMMATPVFADDLLDNAKDLIANYYDALSLIAIGIAMILALVALIMWFVFPSDKGAEQGKKWFIRILLCIFIILSLGSILALIQNLTANSGFNASEYVNSIPKVK